MHAQLGFCTLTISRIQQVLIPRTNPCLIFQGACLLPTDCVTLGLLLNSQHICMLNSALKYDNHCSFFLWSLYDGSFCEGLRHAITAPGTLSITDRHMIKAERVSCLSKGLPSTYLHLFLFKWFLVREHLLLSGWNEPIMWS